MSATTALPVALPRPARWAADETRLVADWRGLLFLHYALPPAALAGTVPFPLDTFEERAFVSLVFFSLDNLHPPGTGRIGRLLLAPISDHFFLNVRTYVRHETGDGIYFIAEWIPNRLSLHLGPLTYGLPYRLGAFEHRVNRDTGVEHLRVVHPRNGSALNVAFPEHRPATARSCAPGSTDAFLLERYTAFTCRDGVRRRFEVDHAPWQAARPDWVRSDPALLHAVFPWFREAVFHSAHQSEGVFGVRMGRPHRLA